MAMATSADDDNNEVDGDGATGDHDSDGATDDYNNGRRRWRQRWRWRRQRRRHDGQRANYGLIRVMQSCFVSSTRMSSTFQCASVHSTSINTKSSCGGSKSLGEMECMQLMASGMKYCMQEFVERSNMCNVQVCRTCRCLRIVCVCAKDNIVDSDSVVSNVDIVGMPYKSIVSIVSWKVGFDINTRLDL